MADEEAGTEGPPMAPKPIELEGWPPTVPARGGKGGGGGAGEPFDTCVMSRAAKPPRQSRR